MTMNPAKFMVYKNQLMNIKISKKMPSLKFVMKMGV